MKKPGEIIARVREWQERALRNMEKRLQAEWRRVGLECDHKELRERNERQMAALQNRAYERQPEIRMMMNFGPYAVPPIGPDDQGKIAEAPAPAPRLPFWKRWFA